MKLKDAPIKSQVQFNGNKATVLKHGAMGCSVKITESKRDSVSLGNQVLSNETPISSWVGVDPVSDTQPTNIY